MFKPIESIIFRGEINVYKRHEHYNRVGVNLIFYSKSKKDIHFKAIAYRQPYLYTCTDFWKRQRTHYTLILENFGNKKIVQQ